MGTQESNFESAHTLRGRPYRQPVTDTLTISHALERSAKVWGDRPAISTQAAPEGSRSVSFAEIHRHSARMLTWMREQAGVNEGDVVAVAPQNNVTSIVAVLALLRGGNPVLLVGPTDPRARVTEQMGAVSARQLFRAGPTDAPDAADLPHVDSLTDVMWPRAEIDPWADALYIGTSGSTAESKIVAQSAYNAAVNAAGLARHHAIRPGDRILGCLPIHHVNGLHFTVLGSLAAGAHVLLLDGFDPFGYVRSCQSFRPRLASVVPSVLQVLLDSWRMTTSSIGLEYFVSAAAPLTSRTAAAVMDRMGVRVMQGYGLTETTNFATTIPIGLSETAYRAMMIETDYPSVGVAFADNEVAILRPDGALARPGEEGELSIRGHNIMNGYTGNQSATSEAFAHGWFHSGDLGFRYREPSTGNWFHAITGRSKNVAKVGGIGVSLDEVDRVLRSHPGVRDAGTIRVPHRLLGEEIIMFVALQGSMKISDVRDHLRAHFAPNIARSRLEELHEIPRTLTGKLIRQDLVSILGL